MAESHLADIKRFFQCIAIADGDDCWQWQRARTHDGYGQFGVGIRTNSTFKLVYAHVWAFTTFVGPIPDGKELDHLCKNRGCANPSHLEPVTHKENVQRGISANREKTECKAGHMLAGENLYVTPTGKRMCRECRRRRSREHGKRTGWAAQKAFKQRQSS